MEKSRTIKFRGKMIPENEWIYGTLLRIPHPPVCTGKEEIDKYYIQFADPRYMPDWNMPYKMVQGEVIPETVGQYTGLKDKNGKEIYEGDIVSEKGHYVNSDKLVYQKIQWKENYSCWLRGEYQRLTPKNIKNYSIEVIGNIYDNPELLTEKE